jgi:NAD(P)-dependent dehydrogenase (short-subunit alcohol dehydrogenase family)
MSTVLITGANRGLGLELTRVYRSAGHTVIGACRNPSQATDLQATGAELCALDMSDMGSISAFAASQKDRPIDLLYNSAGVDTRAFGATDATRTALTITPEDFESVMRVNVTGPMALVQAMTPSLRAARGTVVNISSQIGSMEVAKKMGRDVAYATSKAALNMVTLKQSQALVDDGVTVIALHPGWLRTEMGGSSADLEPAEAASQIVANVGTLTIADTGRFIRWDGTTHPW